MTRSWGYSLFGVDQPLFDPSNRFQTSHLFSPLVLACLRLLIAVYIFTTEIYNLAYDAVAKNGGTATHWSYFTNITYWSLGFYFLFSSFHGAVYARSGSAPLQAWPRLLQLLHSLLYTTIVMYPFLVTAVFWGILASDDTLYSTYTIWSNVSVHALNSAFALFELTVPRTERPPLVHLPFVILFLACYLALAYVTYSTEHFYTYDFLNPANGPASICGYVFGILAAILLLFGLVSGFIWARNWLFERGLGLQGKFATSRRSGDAIREDKPSIVV